MKVLLNNREVQELQKQDPGTKDDGGFQSLMVRLQKKLSATGELALDDSDLEQIPRYAFKDKNGGWQNRLQTIFGRTLGPKLDGNV